MTYTTVHDDNDELMLDRVVDWSYLEDRLDEGVIATNLEFWSEVRRQFEAAGVVEVTRVHQYAVVQGLFPEYREAMQALPGKRTLAVGSTCVREHKIETEDDLRVKGGRTRCMACFREDGQKQLENRRAARALAVGTEMEEAVAA